MYATAHPRKWQTLAALGIDEEHVASSRSTEFRDTFLSATGGRGMDVVLDSLTGELVDASLAAEAQNLSEHEALSVRGVFASYGSCSLTDPVKDLEALGLL